MKTTAASDRCNLSAQWMMFLDISRCTKSLSFSGMILAHSNPNKTPDSHHCDLKRTVYFAILTGCFDFCSAEITGGWTLSW